MTRDVPWDWCEAEEPPPPPLRDLVRRDAAGAAARLWHVTHRAQGAAQRAMLAAFRAAPAPWGAAAAGRVVAPLARWHARDTLMAARMDGTLARLRPDLDAAGRAAMIDRWFANTVRAMCGYPKLATLAAPPHTTTEGAGHLRAVRATGRPLVVASVHTGMWEILAFRASRDFEDHGVGTWQPQPNRHDNRIVAAERRRLGIKVLPASPRLARRLAAILSEPGAGLALMVDEVSEGRIKFPLLGRRPEGRSNLSFALRMMQRLDGLVIPATITRTGPDRHVFRYHDPFGIGSGAEGIAEAQARLDGVLGAHVRAHLDQWYMLQNVEPRELGAVSRPSARRPAAR
nr:hypothetical protein [Jannaschia sp. Os4]